MATTVKKVLGTSTKYVINFDSQPTAKDLLDFVKSIPTADRQASLKAVSGGPDLTVKSPTRFVFVLESEQETDVPIV